MTRRSKSDRKKIPRTPGPGTNAPIVRDDYGIEPICGPPPATRELGCMNGGRFATCDCLVCMRAKKGGA